MLGWEFPPFFAGGIGIVCYELTKALTEQGVEVTYIMPFGPKNINPGFLNKLLVAENVAPNLKIHRVSTLMHAYQSSDEYDALWKSKMLEDTGADSTKQLYGQDLMQEVHNFAHRAMAIADMEDFDVIHCHDWMTIPAAVGIKQRTGKPLAIHVHNTVFDRYLSGSNNVEYDIEQMGLNEADVIVCISNYVCNTLINNYKLDPAKIRVVHNASPAMKQFHLPAAKISHKDKVVLFAGRITIQKGPDYFVHAARIICDHDPNVKFVMAGSGDMLNRMIELSADVGLAEKFLFPGFYAREEADKLFAMADVFVMPSVSEPFGLVPLEAMHKGTPVIISKQSGVAEILNHVLKVDFWNVHELAEKILAVLRYEELHHTLKEHGNWEVQALTWDKSAAKVKQIYEEMI